MESVGNPGPNGSGRAAFGATPRRFRQRAVSSDCRTNASKSLNRYIHLGRRPGQMATGGGGLSMMAAYR